MYDVIVIGGGPGGYVAAIRGAQRGGKIALVEADRLGGCCLNRGCIPTKALVTSAEVYGQSRRAGAFGVRIPESELDLPLVLAHKEAAVRQLTDGVKALLKANGVEVFAGRARVLPGLKVEVELNGGGRETLVARDVVLATGSRPQTPPVSPAALSLTISSDDALAPRRIPERLLIIGGGVLGVEFACIYSEFGSKVQMIKRTPKILPPVDEELGKRLLPILKRKGITVTTGVFIKDIRELSGGGRLVQADGEGGPLEFPADEVLVAMGRVPDFGGIDLDSLGVKHGAGGIEVNARMQTSVPGIWAIGDVTGRYFLASVASAQGLVAMDNIFGRHREMNYRVVPAAVFSIPEAASVGLSEAEARARGEIKVSRFAFAANGRAVASGETDGMVKLLADADSGKLLGCHILGPHATDLIHEAAIALQLGARAEDLADAGFAHPTFSEAILEAAHGLSGEAIHMIRRN
ncbi:MAG TPA: dihydrolipoyl dehydrogenase [Clostridiales bacterium]|nr:dihydrolipoyl dehydrogenase [Clostridiales bacterium]